MPEQYQAPYRLTMRDEVRDPDSAWLEAIVESGMRSR
jgi:hypothetical protein